MARIMAGLPIQPWPAEPSLSVFHKGSAALITVTLTDDFLYIYSHEYLFPAFKAHTGKDVPVVTQGSNTLTYANVCIV